MQLRSAANGFDRQQGENRAIHTGISRSQAAVKTEMNSWASKRLKSFFCHDRVIAKDTYMATIRDFHTRPAGQAVLHIEPTYGLPDYARKTEKMRSKNKRRQNCRICRWREPGNHSFFLPSLFLPFKFVNLCNHFLSKNLNKGPTSNLLYFCIGLFRLGTPNNYFGSLVAWPISRRENHLLPVYETCSLTVGFGEASRYQQLHCLSSLQARNVPNIIDLNRTSDRCSVTESPAESWLLFPDWVRWSGENHNGYL